MPTNHKDVKPTLFALRPSPVFQTPSSSSSGSSYNKKARGDGPKPQPRQNTAIYVTGIPPDATVDEVHEVFSRKCGVIAEEIDSGKPRIKLYTDSEGNPKGDALVVFFKPESVEMAIMLLDDTTFRFGKVNDPPMRIQAADSSYKKTQYVAEDELDSKSKNGTDADGTTPAAVPAAERDDEAGANQQQDKKVRTEKEKQKIRRKAEKLQNKLADWSDDDGHGMADQKKKSTRWDKTVILKHMFTLKELEEDPAAILDIKEDVRDECERIGEVKNVVMFDLEPEGVMSVKFSEEEAAETCVRMMNGRNFGGQVVEASIATGKERYKQSKKKQDVDSDSD